MVITECNLLTDFLQICSGSINIFIHKSLAIIIDNEWVWLECRFLKALAIIFIFCMPTKLGWRCSYMEDLVTPTPSILIAFTFLKKIWTKQNLKIQNYSINPLFELYKFILLVLVHGLLTRSIPLHCSLSPNISLSFQVIFFPCIFVTLNLIFLQIHIFTGNRYITGERVPRRVGETDDMVPEPKRASSRGDVRSNLPEFVCVSAYLTKRVDSNSLLLDQALIIDFPYYVCFCQSLVKRFLVQGLVHLISSNRDICH